MQVADFKTEVDNDPLQYLPEQITKLQENVAQLEEENTLLEAQLEEQKAEVRQTFELRCALQQIHLQLQHKDNDIARLEAQLAALSPPKELSNGEEPHNLSSPSHPVLDVKTTSTIIPRQPLTLPLLSESIVDLHESDPHDTPEKQEEEDIDDLGLRVSEQLLEEVTRRASEAALQVEVSHLEAELSMSRAEIDHLKQEADDYRLSQLRLERRLVRDVLDLKLMLRRERAERAKCEAECQRLLSKTLDLSIETLGSSPFHDLVETPSTTIGSQDTTTSMTKVPVLPPHLRLVSGEFVVPKSSHDVMTSTNQFMDQLAEKEKAFQDQLSKKTIIISYLLKKYGLQDDVLRMDPSLFSPIVLSPKSYSQRDRPSQGFFSSLWSFSTSSGQPTTLLPLSTDETEKVIEDTLLENMRLRRDLQILAAGNSQPHHHDCRPVDDDDDITTLFETNNNSSCSA